MMTMRSSLFQPPKGGDRLEAWDHRDVDIEEVVKISSMSA